VIWVWSLLSWPSAAFNGNNPVSMASIFPGDGYVDWVGIECYNTFHESDPDSKWRNCKAIMDAAYREAEALQSARPMMVVEMGSLEKPGDASYKAGWITNALSPSSPEAILNLYPRIKAILWWNDMRVAANNTSSLAISSSAAAIQAFKEAVADPVYGGELSPGP